MQAPPFSIFYAGLAEIVCSTVDVAKVFQVTGAPPNPKAPG